MSEIGADKPRLETARPQSLPVSLAKPFPLPEGSEEDEYYRNRKILIVDDETGIRKSLTLYLQNFGFCVEECIDGDEARRLLDSDDYFLVLTDITMPGMDGLELLAYIKALNREIDVVMITGHMDIDYAIESIKQGAFDYFKKPIIFDDLRHTINRVIEQQTFKRKSLELERVKERGRIEAKNVAEFMVALAGIIDAKSAYTREHSDRVSRYSITMAHLLNLPGPEVDRIGLGAKMHDIGKIGTPDYILEKNGPLTDEEYEIIKQHPAKGAELIQPISSLKDLTEMVHFHHENMDGSGYPLGLKGAEIPLAARIVRIADYWDAITSHRPYRKPMSFQEAASVLCRECGRSADRELAELFFAHLERKAN